MIRTALLSILTLLALSARQPVSAAEGEGFESIFDGKSLEGWEGKEKVWSVKDGAITGQTTAENPTSGNTFLIWKKADVANFELHLKFRIVGGNSGIQYRSVDKGNSVVNGYQADIDATNGYLGILYEEGGRGILANRGKKVEISADGKKSDVGVTEDDKTILATVKKEDWNDYAVIAIGNRLVHKVNGHTTIELTDNEASRAKSSGILALQLHACPPMLIQFKDILIKKLP